jgi:RHS repeat-associated protein
LARSKWPTYGYDALDRLNAYTLPSQAQVTYGYDYDGNRLSETQSGVTVNHTYGTTSNRQLTAAGASIGYDNNGNRISDTGGSRTFTYDVRNRLKQVIANSQTVGAYTINALGQRVRKVAGSSDIDYVYDLNGNLIGEYANGTLIREYVYLDSLPVSQIASSGAITYLHPDHLGTPRSATNSNAQVVWRWDSDPFGRATPNEDPDGDLTNVTVNLRFPGQYFDMETAFNYNYFRDYDASSGRYVESDPIGLEGGTNIYAYALANPMRLFDVPGLDALVITGGVRDGSINVFGHVGEAVTGNGMFSYGNGTQLGGSVVDYIQSQGEVRDQMVTIVPTTPDQDVAMLKYFDQHPDNEDVGYLDNCAVRTNEALISGGVPVGGIPFPGGIARDVAGLPGSNTYFIPQGTAIPPALRQVLPSFERQSK